MKQTKQATLPLIEGIPDLWLMLKVETPFTPSEFRILQHAIVAKMNDWLAELAPGKGTLQVLPGYEVAAWAQEHVAKGLEEIRKALQANEKPESLRIIGIVQELLREDAAAIRKRNEEGLANLEPGRREVQQP